MAASAKLSVTLVFGNERGRMVQLADLDCDGLLDAVVANEGLGYGSVLLGQGNGSFSAPQVIGLPGGGFSVAAADINEDGVADLVFGLLGFTSRALAVNTSQ